MKRFKGKLYSRARIEDVVTRMSSLSTTKAREMINHADVSEKHTQILSMIGIHEVTEYSLIDFCQTRHMGVAFPEIVGHIAPQYVKLKNKRNRGIIVPSKTVVVGGACLGGGDAYMLEDESGNLISPIFPGIRDQLQQRNSVYKAVWKSTEPQWYHRALAQNAKTIVNKLKPDSVKLHSPMLAYGFYTGTALRDLDGDLEEHADKVFSLFPMHERHIEDPSVAYISACFKLVLSPTPLSTADACAYGAYTSLLIQNLEKGTLLVIIDDLVEFPHARGLRDIGRRMKKITSLRHLERCIGDQYLQIRAECERVYDVSYRDSSLEDKLDEIRHELSLHHHISVVALYSIIPRSGNPTNHPYLLGTP